jgi:hypothetical protein
LPAAGRPIAAADPVPEVIASSRMLVIMFA